MHTVYIFRALYYYRVIVTGAIIVQTVHMCNSNNLCSQFSSLCCAESHHSPTLFRHPPNRIPAINQHHFTTPYNPDCQHQLIHYPVIPNQYPSPYSAIHPDTVPYPQFGVYNDPWPPPYIDDWCPAVAPYPTLCYDDRMCSSEKT